MQQRLLLPLPRHWWRSHCASFLDPQRPKTSSTQFEPSSEHTSCSTTNCSRTSFYHSPFSSRTEKSSRGLLECCHKVGIHKFCFDIFGRWFSRTSFRRLTGGKFWTHLSAPSPLSMSWNVWLFLEVYQTFWSFRRTAREICKRHS